MERKAFISKIDGVASSLGFLATYNEGSPGSERHQAMLTKDSQEITISAGQYGKPGRLVVSGCFPKSDDGYYYGPRNGSHSITVADTKESSVIAKDITRRLLPSYIEALDEALKNVSDRNDEIVCASNALHSVANALGVEPHFSNNMESSGDGSVWCSGFAGFHADYRSGGNFEVKLNLDLEKVLNLIAYLKGDSLTEIAINREDIDDYCDRMNLESDEREHLQQHLVGIVNRMIGYMSAGGWKDYFYSLCASSLREREMTNG